MHARITLAVALATFTLSIVMCNLGAYLSRRATALKGLECARRRSAALTIAPPNVDADRPARDGSADRVVACRRRLGSRSDTGGRVGEPEPGNRSDPPPGGRFSPGQTEPRRSSRASAASKPISTVTVEGMDQSGASELSPRCDSGVQSGGV